MPRMSKFPPADPIFDMFNGFMVESIGPSTRFWGATSVRFFLYNPDVELNNLNDSEIRKATFDYVNLIITTASATHNVMSMDLEVECDQKLTDGRLTITIAKKDSE